MSNTNSIEKEAVERIKCRLQQYGQSLDQVEQLCLDDIEIAEFTPAIREQIQRCKNCQYLTLNHCEIKSLQGFPSLPYVSALQLIGNQITGEQLIHLQNCAQIQMLALDQNKIAHVQDFAHLNNLKQIEHLQIRGNPVCLIEDYRTKIFEIAHKLKIIDCQDAFGDQDVMFGTETDQQNSDDFDSQNSDQNSLQNMIENKKRNKNRNRHRNEDSEMQQNQYGQQHSEQPEYDDDQQLRDRGSHKF